MEVNETNNMVPDRGESEPRPKTLYRAFTVDPRTLTSEFFTRPLVPGRRSKDDPAKIEDGNEYGVYMSTNRTMSETAYASTRIKGLVVPTDRFNDNGGLTENILLPTCGVVVEIDTDNLDIRKPKLLDVFQENNGFQGREWIAGEIPPQNYRVLSLKLSTHPTDRDRYVVDIDPNDPDSLEKGIDEIKQVFEQRMQSAQEYAEFIKSLDPKDRLSEFSVKRKWEAYLKSKEMSEESS